MKYAIRTAYNNARHDVYSVYTDDLSHAEMLVQSLQQAPGVCWSWIENTEVPMVPELDELFGMIDSTEGEEVIGLDF